MSLPNTLYSTQQLLDNQTLIWNHIFNYINSLSLKCAVQLGIPDIIHKHGKPITLSQLVDALSINKTKSHGLYRLMRILVHSKIFNKMNVDNEEAYSLTMASSLLLRNEPLSIAPFVLAMINPVMMDPFHHLIEWFHDDHSSPFVTKNGRDLWEFGGSHDKWNKLFNDAMASDARFMANIVVKQCSHVFEGLRSIVDVGGGTGSVSKAVVEVFPELKCTVLDLHHVVDGLEDSENVKFVSGDMLEFVPPADAIFLKSILHDWGDEDCVKILGKCKEALPESSGKVIILDIIVDGEKQGYEATETQLCFDMLMLAVLTGKERSEKEWANLFYSAGFKNYKVHPICGMRSVIEVFP